jgi:hypothetical protein
METEKKQWTKPELLVLVRNKPEEAVLVTCKGVNAGPLAGYSACSLDANPMNCGYGCSLQAAS